MSFTLADLLMGRIEESELTPEMLADGEDLLEKVNALLADFYTTEAPARKINSGYRSPAINAAAGGAAKSKHMLCQAVDLSDADNKLGRWLTMFPEKLVKYDLYMEAKSSTPTWVHLQLTPPKSRKRVFFP